MRAINLIPRDARRGSGIVQSGMPSGPGYLLLIGLAVALVFVTLIVTTDNTISSRRARLASLRSQLASEQALAGRLASYQRFEQLAQERAQTVRSIVQGRFDWQAAMSDLSKVVPASTALQSLSATVSPSTSAGGAATSSLRGAISAPAFDITGCTQSQDDVARLMSRLRTINGVTRVTLQSSTESTGTPSAATTSPTPTSSTGPATCGNGPSFHLVVFFSPLPSLAPVAGSPTQSATPPSAGRAAPAAGAPSGGTP